MLRLCLSRECVCAITRVYIIACAFRLEQGNAECTVWDCAECTARVISSDPQNMYLSLQIEIYRIGYGFANDLSRVHLSVFILLWP